VGVGGCEPFSGWAACTWWRSLALWLMLPSLLLLTSGLDNWGGLLAKS